LKAFGRRPPCKQHRCDRPASETLNSNGHMVDFARVMKAA
jgi:hypothetical protein